MGDSGLVHVQPELQAVFGHTPAFFPDGGLICTGYIWHSNQPLPANTVLAVRLLSTGLSTDSQLSFCVSSLTPPCHNASTLTATNARISPFVPDCPASASAIAPPMRHRFSTPGILYYDQFSVRASAERPAHDFSIEAVYHRR